jgi:flagellar FliL protein
MAKDGKDGKDGKDQKKGKGGKLKLVVPIVLLLGAGLAARSLLLGGSAAEAGQKPKEQEGPIVTMDPLTVNLADAGFHYAQAGIGIVLTATANQKTVEERLPLFKDAAIRVIGAFESRELKTLKGQEELRKELTQAASQVYGDEAIYEVVLTQIIVQ